MNKIKKAKLQTQVRQTHYTEAYKYVADLGSISANLSSVLKLNCTQAAVK